MQTSAQTARATTIVFDVPDWPGHRAGQHLDVRLTAEDGYQTERSYSISSAPQDAHVAITVERLDDGEVSPYLAAELRPGDQLELRGPIGGYFIWEPGSAGAGHPVQLVAGGSGVAPFRSMLRHRHAVGSDVPMRLLCSARSLDLLWFREELTTWSEPGVHIMITLSREQPPGWTGFRGRIDRAMLRDATWPAGDDPLSYVCGPTPFVEFVAATLVELGHDPSRIRTERFGGTGT